MQRWRLSRGRKKKPKRRGYVRPSRAAAMSGWSLRQLGGLVGLAPRTLKRYLASGVVVRSAFKGPATRYQRPQLVRLVVAVRLRAAEKLSLAAIRTRLQALSASELEALAREGVPPGPLAEALGISSPSAPLRAAVDPDSLATGASSVGPRWSRVELALGLELHLREDASPQALELVRRIRGLSANG